MPLLPKLVDKKLTLQCSAGSRAHVALGFEAFLSRCSQEKQPMQNNQILHGTAEVKHVFALFTFTSGQQG